MLRRFATDVLAGHPAKFFEVEHRAGFLDVCRRLLLVVVAALGLGAPSPEKSLVDCELPDALLSHSHEATPVAATGGLNLHRRCRCPGVSRFRPTGIYPEPPPLSCDTWHAVEACGGSG